MRRRPVPVTFQQQVPLQPGAPSSESAPVAPDPDGKSHHGKTRKVRRLLNFRFLLISSIVACVLAVGMYGIHYLQIQRTAGSLLQRAEQLIADKQPKEAISYLQRYLSFAPDDVKARLLFCQMLEQVSRTQREQVALFLALDDLLRRAPEHDAQRRTLCGVALRIGRFPDARFHLDYLLKSAPKDGELLFQLARCDEADEKYPSSADLYRSAITNGWNKPEAYVRLANIESSKLDHKPDADKQIDAMIAANPDSSEAFLLRSRWRLAAKNSTGALEDIRRAQTLAPDNVEVQLMAAELIRRQEIADPESLKAIQKSLDRLVKSHPKDGRLYAMLALLGVGSDQKDESEKWLRRGVEAIPTNFELRMQLIQLLIDRKQYELAQEQLSKLSMAATTQPIIEGVRNMLESTILIRQEQWSAARDRLLNARTQLISRPELLDRATALLATCFRQLHDRTSEIEAYRAILKGNPLDKFARAGLASAQAASGHADEALADLKSLNDVPGQIRLLMQQQLKLPEEKRRWDELQTAVDAALSAAPMDSALTILASQIQMAQKNVPAATQILDEARAKQPKEIRLWIAASELAQSQQDWPRSAALLEQAEKELGDIPILQQAWATHWANQGGQESQAALEKIEQGLSRFPAEEQSGILTTLASVYRKQNRPTDSLRLWGKVAKLRPNDLDVQMRFFGTAFELENQDQMRKAAAGLRRIEGRDGPYATFAQAAELLRQGRENPARLVDAQRLLAQVEKERPDWPLIWLCKARIDEFNIVKDGDEAIANYRQALELNDQNPAILHRIVQLQRDRQLWSDALATIRKYTDLPGAWASADYCCLASEVFLRTGDPGRARELAKTAVRTDPQSARSQLWLGTLLSDGDQTADASEAEAALRKAVELQPKLDGAWIVLAKLLVRGHRATEAATAVAEAAKHLTEKNQSLALGLCYEAIGDRTKAGQLIETGLAALPRDPATLKTATLFYIRNNQPDKAEVAIRTLLSPAVNALPGDRFSAQRLLTLVLARRNYHGFRESLAELEKQSKSASREEIRSEQLFKARVLSSWPFQKERKRAVQLLEDEERRAPLVLLDAALLAEQYDAIGEPKKAEVRWGRLLDAHGNDPVVLTSAVRHYLKWQHWDQAAPLLVRLKELKPNDLATLELEAQAQVLQGHADETVKLIDQYVADKTPEPTPQFRLTSAAVLLDRLSVAPKLSTSDRDVLNRAAERLYRQLAADKPAAMLGVAGAVARQGKVDEALALCEKIEAGVPALQVSARAIAILHDIQPKPEQVALVERLLQKSLKEPSDAVAGAIQQADLRWIQHRYDDVIVIYRQILTDNPKQIVALNNLAWFLAAHQRQYAEAEQLIERAIGVAGPQPTLVDTRGTIRLMAGKWNDAIADFTASLKEQDTQEVRFRLAAAEWNAGNQSEAKEMLRKVLDGGFVVDKKLTPLELDAYSGFLKEFLAAGAK